MSKIKRMKRMVSQNNQLVVKKSHLFQWDITRIQLSVVTFGAVIQNFVKRVVRKYPTIYQETIDTHTASAIIIELLKRIYSMTLHCHPFLWLQLYSIILYSCLAGCCSIKERDLFFFALLQKKDGGFFYFVISPFNTWSRLLIRKLWVLFLLVNNVFRSKFLQFLFLVCTRSWSKLLRSQPSSRSGMCSSSLYPSLSRRVKKVTATTSAPAIIDEDIVMSFLPAHPSPGEDGFSPKRPTPLPLLPPNFLLHSLACLIT